MSSEENKIEKISLKVLKRIMLIIFGTGILTNAAYFHGQAFYEGYIKRLGFDYSLFPITWDESIFWTYLASRYIGLESILLFDKLTYIPFIFIFITLYVFIHVWIKIESVDKKYSEIKDKTKPDFIYKIENWFETFAIKHKLLNVLIFTPIKFIFSNKQSLYSFAASYFVIVFGLFALIILMIWTTFPLIGLNHGNVVADKYLSDYKETLCVKKSSYWNECMNFTTKHIKNKNIKEPIIRGEIFLKNKNLLGIMTKTGPVTMTAPKNIFHQSVKNICYLKENCKETFSAPKK